MMLGYEELTEPERAVWSAIGVAAVVELPIGAPTTGDPAAGETWGKDRQVRAQLLYELLTGINGPKDARPHALGLTGARITGTLDLQAATLACPLVLRRCTFEQPINLREAQAPAIRLPGCHVPGFNGAQLQTRGDLQLSHGFTAQGEVNLAGAHIGGALSFENATLTNPGGRALYGDWLTVGQSMLCRELTAQGQMILASAHIRSSLEFDGSSLTNAKGPALSANELTVDGSMFCRNGFTAHGEVDLVGGHIGGQLDFQAATLTNTDPMRSALAGDGLTVDRGVFCHMGFTAEGEVNLAGSHVGGQLVFDDATLTNPEGYALVAQALTVNQQMFCRNGFTARGQVNLVGAHIGGRLVFDGATLTNPKGLALVADGLTVDQDMFCRNGFTAHGEVRLLGAHINGTLGFEEATLTNPGGWALDLERVRATTLFLRPKVRPQGAVELINAQVHTCYDSEATWPEDLRLEGFAYQALVADPEVDAMARLRWLERDPGGYRPQVYEQLADAYRKAGRDDDARKVAIAKQRRRRQTLSGPGKVWNSMLRWTVGYGYQTWKAGVWLLALVGLGWWIFDRAHPVYLVAATPPGQRPWFHAGLYALDLLLPFVDLGYQGAWIAGGWARGFYLIWNLAGWVLITAVVAALSGLIKRE
jgi:hypothetical protein